jgi:hypothetical protein
MSNDEEARATSPPAPTSAMVGARIKEEPGTAQPGNGISNSIDQSS